ncbi:WXG100 family type VII secretion target [Dietzia cinnamea]|uniref:PPE family protein n=1 Tax=Dietzia cinnamea TaxID=321318 RepID=A0A4R3ZTH5_9ACTN|nr:hypothetical protein [Dietzia cinnamea]TCW23643.1 hypothetical protein EDD19_11179 [Dietzia cinnamea]
MSMLFAAAGGLIEAQDEAVAAALGKAAEEPAGLQSLGLTGSLGSITALLDAADGTTTFGGYGRVGPEDVSTSPLERMVEAARALDADQFAAIATRMTEVSTALEDAATGLHSGLSTVLGHTWQGDFADRAQESARGLVTSALELAGQLNAVAEKADGAQRGFATTRQRIISEAADVTLAESRTPGFGRLAGPVAPSMKAEVEAARQAAEEQARAIVNTEYSPAVMDANLDDLDFTAAYRVVSTTALGGPDGIDMAKIWNTEGIPRPAQPAAPNPATLAALTGGAGGEGGGAATGGAGGGGATTGPPGAVRDAATEQALLAARTGPADGSGTAAPGSGQAGGGQPAAGQPGAGGGVNAATTAAAAPITPITAANGQQGGAAGAGGIRGIRGGASGDGRGRDRGFGSTSGLLGGGGAAAAGAGAGASRMGGAGTLAGFGAGGAAGPGGGAPAAGAPGAGPAPGGAAGSGAGALSSSSPGTAAGRAGAMPMGGVMGAANAGQNSDRRGHTPASYLTNATNTTAIIGEPVKVAPAVLGRPRVEEPAPTDDAAEPYRGRTLGRDYTGGGAARD